MFGFYGRPNQPGETTCSIAFGRSHHSDKVPPINHAPNGANHPTQNGAKLNGATQATPLVRWLAPIGLGPLPTVPPIESLASIARPSALGNQVGGTDRAWYIRSPNGATQATPLIRWVAPIGFGRPLVSESVGGTIGQPHRTGCGQQAEPPIAALWRSSVCGPRPQGTNLSSVR